MLLSLLASPLARRILGVALAFAALAAIVFSIYHAGKHAGADDEASRQVAAGKSSFERIEADARLDAASAREQQLATLAEKLSADSASASARAAAAQSASATDRARISALSDASLRADLAARLGLSSFVIPSGVPRSGTQSRNPSASLQANPSSGGNPAGEGNSPPSNSPGGRSFDSKSRDDSGSAAASALSSPEALRAIDARLSDCEHLSEQTAALTQQVAALTARDSARATQLTAVTSERDAALDAYNQLVPLYAQAFRAATHRRRRWFCLFVCSTGPRLNLPPPLRVSPPAPNAPNISPAVAPAIPDCQ